MQLQKLPRADRAMLSLRQPLLPARAVPSSVASFRIGCKVACRAADVDASPSPEASSSEGYILLTTEDSDKAFAGVLPMSPAQRTLSSLPLAVFYPALLAFVGCAGLVGSGIGASLPVDPEAKDMTSAGTAVLVGAAAVYASFLAKKKRDSAAVVDLYNSIVELADPCELTQDMVQGIGSKYGINLKKAELDSMQKIYEQYLESLIPGGDTQLKGTEADSARAFKEALGLSDEEAAPAHLEVARRMYRQGFETKDRQQQFEQRKAFQRLVYVSQLVFGDQKAAFLLPWRRHFELTDAQIFVARRDNAKTIFKILFEADGGDLKADRHFLRELRDKQLAVKMMDESAEEVIKEFARRNVERHLITALSAIKATGKNKNLDIMVEEMQHVLDYSRKMLKMADEEDLVPGLGQVTIQGGMLAADGRSREVKDLYRAYLEEQIERHGEFTAALDHEAKELQTILNLGSKDAQVMRDEAAAKLYKRLLKEEVTSRRIDEAASPAAVLQQLCERVRFGPESALELHKQLYRTKMTSLVSKGKLTEEDEEDLKRIRRILCIPTDVSNKVAKETCGKPLLEVLDGIFSLGVRPVSEAELKRVDKVMKDLAISADVGVEVLSQAAQDKFRAYIKESQKEKEDRKASASFIKQLVQFNALVVSPLLDRIKGKDAAMKELAELLAKATEEAKKEGAADAVIDVEKEKGREDTIKQVQKAIQANRGEFGDDESKGQKEITLKDVDDKIKADIYKNYLMYTMTGDMVELPVGGMVRKKNNPSARQADMARLTQLADILGMGQMEVMKAQQDLAEQAYKGQVTEVMRSGPMTQEKSQYLEDMRNQLGISKEAGERVLKATRTEVFGASAAALEEGGRWTLDRIMEVTKAGGSIDGQIEETTRRNIFRKELERKVSDGSGDLDPEFVLQQLPKMLSLEERKVKQVVKELVSSRKRMLLVQAVSQYRQKRPAETVISLQNLLSCLRALPESQPMPWNDRAELRDVFQAYCSEESSQSKREQLQLALGLSAEEARELAAANEGVEGNKVAVEDDIFF